MEPPRIIRIRMVIEYPDGFRKWQVWQDTKDDLFLSDTQKISFHESSIDSKDL